MQEISESAAFAKNASECYFTVSQLLISSYGELQITSIPLSYCPTDSFNNKAYNSRDL